MASRYSLVLSGDLDREIDRVVLEDETTKADVLRKALALYLAARDGYRKGMKVGIVDPESQRLQQEIVGF